MGGGTEIFAKTLRNPGFLKGRKVLIRGLIRSDMHLPNICICISGCRKNAEGGLERGRPVRRRMGMGRGGGLRVVLEAKCWLGCGMREKGRQGEWQPAPCCGWGLESSSGGTHSLVNGVVEDIWWG